MGERDLNRHLAAGAGSPADPDDVGEPGPTEPGPDRPAGAAAEDGSAVRPGSAVQDGPAARPGSDGRAGPVARDGSPSPRVADSDLVEAVAEFVQELVEGGDRGGCGADADDGFHGDGDRPAGEKMTGSTGAG